MYRESGRTAGMKARLLDYVELPASVSPLTSRLAFILYVPFFASDEILVHGHTHWSKRGKVFPVQEFSMDCNLCGPKKCHQMALRPHGTEYKVDTIPSCAMGYLTLPLDLWIHTTSTMTKHTDARHIGPRRKRLRILDKAVQFLFRLDVRVPHVMHEASANSSFHSLRLSQKSNPSIHSTIEMADEQLSLIIPTKQGPFVVAHRKIPQPGPGEVLVRLQATALNPFDARIHRDGTFVDSYPAVLGTDGAGIVEEVGEGVTRFDPGERIFFHGAFDDNDLATFQQFSVVTTDFAAKVPRSLSFDQAATISCGISTAAIGLYGKVNGISLVPPWERVGYSKYKGWPILIMGGAGSVGNYVIQLAKLSGFSPIITTSSLKHTEYLKSIGANYVIDRHLPPPALKQAVMKITGSRIHIMYDSISIKDTQEAAWSLLAPGGKLVLTQPSQISKDSNDSRQVVLVDGSPQSDENWETGKRLWAHLERWVEEGHIRPNHVELLPDGLRGIADALARFNAGKVDGVKMVVRPQETNGGDH